MLSLCICVRLCINTPVKENAYSAVKLHLVISSTVSVFVSSLDVKYV